MNHQNSTQNNKQIYLDNQEDWRTVKLIRREQNDWYLVHEISIAQIQKYHMMDSMIEAFNKSEPLIYKKETVPEWILPCEFSGMKSDNNTMQYVYPVPEQVEIITRAPHNLLPQWPSLLKSLVQVFDWHAKNKMVLNEIRPENIYIGLQTKRIYFGMFGSSTLKDFILNLGVSKDTLSASDRIRKLMSLRPTLAPELIAAITNASASPAVVYSIGAVLSRIYLGTFPVSLNVSSLEEEKNPNLITSKNIPPLRTVSNQDDPELATWITNMVETDISKRLSLERLVNQLKLQATPPVDFAELPPGMFRGQGPQTCKYYFEHVLNLVKHWKDFADSLRNSLEELNLKDEKLFRLYISSMMLVSAQFGHSLQYFLKHLTQKSLFVGLTECDTAYQDVTWVSQTKTALDEKTIHMKKIIQTYKPRLDPERSAVTIKYCEFETAVWTEIDDYKKRVFYASISRCAEYGRQQPPNSPEVLQAQKLLTKIFWYVEYERVFPLFVVQNNRNEGTKFDWTHVGAILEHPNPGKIMSELNKFGEIYQDQIQRTMQLTPGAQGQNALTSLPVPNERNRATNAYGSDFQAQTPATGEHRGGRFPTQPYNYGFNGNGSVSGSGFRR